MKFKACVPFPSVKKYMGQCLSCKDEQEYDLTIPANRRDLINVIEAVTPKADVRLTVSIGRNRPEADIRLRKV